MHCLLLLFLISIFGFPNILFSQNTLESGSFIPDEEVEKLATEADKHYFPLFLESFSWIRNQDSLKIPRYFSTPKVAKKNREPGQLSDISSLKVAPVYNRDSDPLKSYQLSSPVNWTDSINPDPTWRLYYQSLLWLMPYLKSRDADSLHTGLVVANDWIVQHLDYPFADCEYAYDDHAVAERLVVLVEALKRYNNLKFSIRELHVNLKLAILNHIFFISSLEKYSCWHNHAIIFDEKLIQALSKLPDLIIREALLDLAFRRVFEQYSYAYTSDGIHKEHSPCYHRDFSRRLNSIIASAEEQKIPVPESILQISGKAADYSRYLDFIGKDFPMGDCVRYSVVKPSENSPVDQQAIRESQTLNSGKQPQVSQLREMRFRVYPNTGWLYAYDSVSLFKVVAQSDFFSFSHYQKDETSFIIKAGSDDLILDPGLYSYSQNKIYDYYRSGNAHNVLVVEGLPEVVDLNNTGLSGITRSFCEVDKNGNNLFAVEMTKPQYRKYGVDIHRQFIFPGGHSIVIRDVVKSKRKHTYKQLFHLAPEAIITRNGNSFVITWKKHGNSMVIKSKFDSYRIVTGQNEPLQGWYFPAFNVIEPAPVLELIREDRSCNFTTSITVNMANSEDVITKKPERKVNHIISKLKFAESRVLTHQPFPPPWKSER